MPKLRHCSLAAWFVAAMALVALGQVHCQTRLQKEKNMEIISRTSPSDIHTEQIALQPLQDAAKPAALPVDKPTRRGGYPCPYGNPMQNSRCSLSLPAGTWEIHWQSSVAEDFEPRFVLTEGDHVVTQAETWQLFDLNGRMLAEGRTRPGQMVIDSSSGLFYSVDINGYLAANQITDGKLKFILLPTGADSYFRPLIVPLGQRIIISGFELARGNHLPNSAAIEVVNLGSSLKIEAQLLTSAVTEKTLHLRVARLTVAANDESVVFAVPNAICFSDRTLKITSAYGSQFKPLAMSLDEAGRAYLIAEAAAERQLWLVTPKGERVILVPKVPSGEKGVAEPPVVSCDHRVYLIAGAKLLCIGADGKQLWDRPLSASCGGTVVTPDDDLLLSDGSELVLFNNRGERRRLFEFPGETLCTPPVLTADGWLLVASKDKLYCLSVKKPK
jgi:hypothetical protein